MTPDENGKDGEKSYFHTEVLNTPGVRHAFLGRFDSPRELDESTMEIFNRPAKEVLTIKQVHGNLVILLDKPLKEMSFYLKAEGDAMVTALPSIPIAVRSADCLPILFYDRKNMAIGAAHAGWRSTLGKVAIKTVEKMQTAFGSEPENIKAAFGPHIGPCCYTVAPDLSDKFIEAGVGTGAFITTDGSTRLDLSRANRDQLLKAGLKEENISDKAPCTSCNNVAFYSYRVEGEKAGRELSIIMIGEGN